MTNTDMKHMNYIDAVSHRDLTTLREKEKTYQGSWKRAGGRSAWFMARRNMDRLITMLSKPESPRPMNVRNTDDTIRAIKDGRPGDIPNSVQVCFPGSREITVEMLEALRGAYYAEDIFAKIEEHPEGEDGTVLACVRDLRCYFTLIEAEMMSRGVVASVNTTIPKDVRGGKGCNGQYIGIGDTCDYRDRAGNHTSGKLVDVVNEQPVMMLDDGLVDAARRITVRWADLFKRSKRSIPRHVPHTMIPRNTAVSGDGLSDTQVRQRTPEDGAQHAALWPWVSTEDQLKGDSFVPEEYLDVFWNKRAADLYVLEPYVVHPRLPRVLRNIYTEWGTSGQWTLSIIHCQEDAREYFPNLPNELNMKEYDEAPEWQRRLYFWSKEGNKWALTPRNAAWHVEPE